MMHDEHIKDGWLELALYCERTGQRQNTIHKRATDGTWPRGEYFASPSGGVCYVNVAKCDAWLQLRGKLTLQ